MFPSKNNLSIRCALCKAVTHIAASPRIQSPPPGQLPHPDGKKRAVICGVSYFNTPSELKSCLKDAKCMQHLLINKFKFPSDSIIMLTGIISISGRNSSKSYPDQAKHKDGLVLACAGGMYVLLATRFSFTSRATVTNYNGDEVDGKNETLCPLDFKTEGNVKVDIYESIYT
ncbi:unnamed protein product [Arabis nemorensis]|uniref:Uncharacterized protein n=1 Tax=Arabis nemorensis TaxID=586526 RepID=A0A565C6V1_9BRAS|nr:unnamed protein product [Arabis nemorensis]